MRDMGKFGQKMFLRQVIDECVEEADTHLTSNERPINAFIFKATLRQWRFLWNTQGKNRTKGERKWLKLHVVQNCTTISIYNYVNYTMNKIFVFYSTTVYSTVLYSYTINKIKHT